MSTLRLSLALSLAAAVLAFPSVAGAAPTRLPPPVPNQSAKAAVQPSKKALKQTLSEAKARVKRGQPFVDRQVKRVNEVSRNLVSAYKTKQAAKARVLEAKLAYNANPTPENRSKWAATSAAYNEAKLPYNIAKALQQKEQTALALIKSQQLIASSDLEQAKQALVKKPPVQRRPVYSNAQYARLPDPPPPSGSGIYDAPPRTGFSPQRSHAYASAADIAKLDNYRNGSAPREMYGALPPPNPYYPLTLIPAGSAGAAASQYGNGPPPPVPPRIRENALGD